MHSTEHLRLNLIRLTSLSGRVMAQVGDPSLLPTAWNIKIVFSAETVATSDQARTMNHKVRDSQMWREMLILTNRIMYILEKVVIDQRERQKTRFLYKSEDLSMLQSYTLARCTRISHAIIDQIWFHQITHTGCRRDCEPEGIWNWVPWKVKRTNLFNTEHVIMAHSSYLGNVHFLNNDHHFDQHVTCQ